MAEGPQINVLANIYNNIKYGLALGKDLIMEQGSARAGKTMNTLIWIILECLNHPIQEREVVDPATMKKIKKQEPLRVSIVRQSLPVIKRSVYDDFKRLMLDFGIWDDKCMNKTDYVYTFPSGVVIEFFSADDEQKLRGPWRHILYCNEANEISFYAFSMLRQRTYGYTIVDYNPSFTEEHWLFPLMTDERTYHFISTYKDNIFLPEAAVREIESYKDTNPALWSIYGEGKFAIVDGLVFPAENWDIIPDEDYPEYKTEEKLGIDWGFVNDPTVIVGLCVVGDDIYLKEYVRRTGLVTNDIAKILNMPQFRDKDKHCDIDHRLITELEAAGVSLLYPTKKNGDSIMTGIRLMNQRKIHICASSTDLIKEFRNYVYRKNRHDEYETELTPIDKFNHGIDASRYAVLANFTDSYYSDERPLTKCDLNLFM